MSQEWKSDSPGLTTNILGAAQDSRKNELSLQSTFEGENPPASPVSSQKWRRASTGITYVYTGSGPYFGGWDEDVNQSTAGRDVVAARGTKPSLVDRLAVSMNPDGTLMNPLTANVQEWQDPGPGLAPTYVNATQFTVAGDQTDIYKTGRGIRATVDGAKYQTYVKAASYAAGAGLTTVTLTNAVLTAGLTKVEHGILADLATAAAVTFTPSGSITAKSVQDALAQLDALKPAIPGIGDYIASGRKMAAGSDLTLTISAGVEKIGNVAVSRDAGSVLLTARRAQLIYDKKDGTTDKIIAALPALDSGTVNAWVVNGDGVIQSLKGTNDLKKYGGITTAAGWAADYAAKGDGATGYYMTDNYTGFPVGAAARELDLVVSYNGGAAGQYFAGYGAPGAGSFYVGVLANGTLSILNAAGTDWISTGYVLESGGKYFICILYDGANATVFVNGNRVYTGVVAFNTNAAALLTHISSAGNWYSSATIHYVELRNALRTPAQIAAISNALLLPCRYYPDPAKPDFSDVRTILPADSIAIGRVVTDATHPAEYNDSDYQFGRREGATGGNRKVFLGWKYYSGNQILIWSNPFGTRKVKVYAVWAQDANGTNEMDVLTILTSGGVNYGTSLLGSSLSNRIAVTTQTGGVVQLNGVWQTSGYIGCYAEVIE